MRHALLRFILLATLWPLQLHAGLIDDIIELQALLEGRCGTRFMIVWVDDSGSIPPCLLSYSLGCEEIQRTDASCLLHRQTDEEPATAI